MGFISSWAEDDIWLRHMKDHYEYIARYVDNMAIVSIKPQTIIPELIDKDGLKLKDSGPIKYHLRCDFFRDSLGVLCTSPRKYIEWATKTYQRMFGAKPKAKFSSPLEPGDHPELDTSPELDANGIK